MLEELIVLVKVFVVFLLPSALLPLVVFVLSFCLFIFVTLAAPVGGGLLLVVPALLVVVVHNMLIGLNYSLVTLLIYANLLCAFLSAELTSGWYFLASYRYLLFTSSILQVDFSPRTVKLA